MAPEVLKLEVDTVAEVCCVCGSGAEDLASLEEHDAALQLNDVPLRTQFLALSQNKSLPSGRICGGCVGRAAAAYEFQSSLRAARPPPALSDKIRALRRRLHDLTQKIDVFIVVGESTGSGETPQYSEEDIIMVDRGALAAAAAADDRELELAANTRGDHVYQCSVCPQSFQKVAEYQAHARAHPADALHSCWTCGAQFAARDALREHRRARHRRRDAAPAVCNLCAETFRNEIELRRHEAAGEAAGCAPRCPAPGCGLRAPDRAALARHAAAAHGRGAPPPCVCAVCFLALDDGEALSAHMLRHRRARQFLCGYDGCILRFPTRNDLMSHIRKCHGAAGAAAAAEGAAAAAAAGAGQPTCAECGRSFGSVAAMKRHARVHSAGGYRGYGARRVADVSQDIMEGDVESQEEELEGEVEYLEVETLEELQQHGMELDDQDIKPDLSHLH